MVCKKLYTHVKNSPANENWGLKPHGNSDKSDKMWDI